MDSVTQFVLGASVSGALLGSRLGARALLIGGVVATLPDLDSFVSFGNAIDNMTYHRGASHSLIVQTAVAPVVAFAVTRIVPATRDYFGRVLLAVWLCLVTHSLLDSLTTYGTQLLWPLDVGPPFALPSVFIIDPAYTLMLIIGIILFWFRRQTPDRAARAVAIMLAAGTAYLAIGIGTGLVMRARAEADPKFAGMRVHVQPTPFNIVFWQVLGVDKDRYTAGLTSLFPGCPIIATKTESRLAEPPNGREVSASVKRLEWFTDGFYTYHNKGDALAITDLRIGFHPTFIFSFEFARKANAGEAFTDIKPTETDIGPAERSRLAGVFGQISNTLNACSA